ncbi:MAG: carboxypeptidase-like regulatory domain-containing protein [Planctomycetota bacterium]
MAGVVLLPNGDPAAEAFLWLDQVVGDGQRAPADYVRESSEIDGTGRFRILVPRAGRYSLQARSREAGPVALEVEVDEARPHPEVVLTLHEFVGIAGRVRREDGSPAAGCRIAGWRAAELPDPLDFDYAEAGAETWWYHGYVAAEADGEGRFRIGPLEAEGLYTLSFQPDPAVRENRALRTDVRAGTEGLEVVLAASELRGAWLHGPIRCETPIGGLQYVLQVKRESSKWAAQHYQNLFDPWRDLPVEEGYYRLEHLTPGREYMAYFRAEGTGLQRIGPWTGDPAGTERELVLGAPCSLEVQVLAPDGLPAPHVGLLLWDDEGFVGDPFRRGGLDPTTDRDGLHLFTDLVPGRYRVTAQDVSGSGRGEATIDVRPGERERLLLQLTQPPSRQ